MFEIIKKAFIVLLTGQVNASNYTKCILNQPEVYDSTYSYLFTS